MKELLTFISLMTVLILHISYIKTAKELIAKKRSKQAIMLLLLGVTGSLLCVKAVTSIYALHLIVILNLMAWKAFVIFRPKENNF